MTGKSRGRPSTGVRQALLAAAEAVLSETGVGKLSTREVARRAGVAESSIFYHFGDRLGLLGAVVREHLPLYQSVAAEVLESAASRSVRDNLLALLDALEAFYVRISGILAAVQADPQLHAEFAGRQSGPQRALGPLIDYLSEERARGRVRAGLDVDSAALLLLGAAHQRALLGHLGGTRLDALPSTASIADTLAASITP
ncbi:TetR/AcrR family transcriptional regulator [Sciscionella sediminilitoris]|uniref:TetR/AcrR family transcriptional regulator n=1 Tax=Sciscionella sediminilitoris TaxID=1445613 RepID=UPI000AD5ABC7|nr:TetR/AcrR family transcriptional regulator [Sciscionella sp. SE31]